MTVQTVHTEEATRILESLGGPDYLQTRVGAKNFAVIPEGLQFRFKGCQLCNTLEITKNDQNPDRYDLEFWLVPSRPTSTPIQIALAMAVPLPQIREEFERVTGAVL